MFARYFKKQKTEFHITQFGEPGDKYIGAETVMTGKNGPIVTQLGLCNIVASKYQGSY